MPGEQRKKITPDKTGKGKHRVEKDKISQVVPQKEEDKDKK